MYKVLLVDDELVDLDWLKNRISWQEAGFEIVAAVNNSFAALDRMRKEHVDLLISDIRMPIMSGLELARKAREALPGLKVIFISGHEEFEYSMEAIKLHALGYVLKPIENNELIKLLNYTVNKLNEEREISLQEQLNRKMYPLAFMRLLQRWLEGSRIDSEEMWLLEKYGIDSSIQYAAAGVVEIDGIDQKLSACPAEEKETILQEVYERVHNKMASCELGCCFQLSEQRMLLILHPLNTIFAEKCLNEMIADIREHTRLTITVGLGPIVSATGDVPDSYKKAVEAVNHKMFSGKSQIISHEAVQDRAAEVLIQLEDRMESLYEAVLGYDLVKIDDELMELFSYVSRLDTKVSVYHFTVQIIAMMDSLLRARISENVFDVMAWNHKALDVLQQFETVDDIQSWLRSRLFELSELLMLRRRKQGRKLIRQMTDYVKENLNQKMTLRQVAERFSFSPNYLGHLFKEETGVPFSDFLNQLRMERAKELLGDPKWKVYEIAERIGYKNVIYFNRQFKEHFGLSPGEYRKKNKV